MSKNEHYAFLKRDEELRLGYDAMDDIDCPFCGSEDVCPDERGDDYYCGECGRSWEEM